MTYDILLDKDRLLFTQCNENFRIRCPICIQEKKFLGHCKMGRNFPSIWSHIRHDHHDIYQDQLDGTILLLNCLYTAYKKQIVTEWPGLATKNQTATTTSSSILIDRHPPRIDQWGKLMKIATVLRDQSTFYPNYRKEKLWLFVKKAAGVYDKRTIQQYFDCVVNYSKKDKIRGVYDVTGFCSTILS